MNRIDDLSIRESTERLLDHLEMHNFNQGFEACINALDEMSNRFHNEGRFRRAEIIRNAVKELTGEED